MSDKEPRSEEVKNNNKDRRESPEDYDFRGRRPNERIVLVIRYHPWLLMPIAFWWVVIIVLNALILSYFGASKWSSLTLIGTLIFGGLYSFYQWFIWNNGNYIITNQRIIRTEQIGLFKRQISEAEVDRIQEIATEVNGPIRTLLNFGTVKIQTASNSGRMDIENVAAPYDIQQAITRVSRQLEESGQSTGLNRPPRMG